MSKIERILVSTMDGNTDIYTDEQLREMELSDNDVVSAFGNNAYWMSFEIKDATFSDQQAVLRDLPIVKDTGLPDATFTSQKRFVRAVITGTWKKKFCADDHEEILPITENAFAELSPPAVANMIDNAILRAWYPGATKSPDFIKTWREQQSKSASVTKSTSTASTPGS